MSKSYPSNPSVVGPTGYSLISPATNLFPQWMQSLSSAYASFQHLRQLKPIQVKSFIKSYDIYNLDWADNEGMLQALGPDYTARVGSYLKDYYGVLNHLCAIGELEKMYIPPIMMMNGSLQANQRLWEETLSNELQIAQGDRVLDLGCGRGQVAAHVTRLTGAAVTGLNIDPEQIKFANNLTEQQNLKNEFVCADFNEARLPFKDNYFDAFYQIQALSLCEDIPKLCKELYRVLKPGARLSMLDWVRLEAFDAANPHHQELLCKIKPLIGAVGTPTPGSVADALTAAGFEVLQADNASMDGLQAPLIEAADGKFASIRMFVRAMCKLGLFEPHLDVLLERLSEGCASFVEADRARLFTTSFHWLAQKPLS